MGKAIIIKGADFSANAIGRIEPPKPELWKDLQNGFWPLAMFNSGCNGNDTWRNVVVPVDTSESKGYVFKTNMPNANILVNWLDVNMRLLGYAYIAADVNGKARIDAYEPFAQSGDPQNVGADNVRYFAIAIPTPGNDTSSGHLTTMTVEQMEQCSLKEVSGE